MPVAFLLPEFLAPVMMTSFNPVQGLWVPGAPAEPKKVRVV